MKFEHLLLTRFNLETSSWSHDKNKQETRTGEWLEHRFQLFEKYCYPSIKNQTNQSFKWLIFFSQNTPAKYRSKIEQYSREMPNLIPVYLPLDSGDKINSYEKNFNLIKDHISKETQFLISTRLDNDDGLSIYAIDAIQKEFRQQDFAFVNLLPGYIYDTQSDKIYHTEEYSNPFLSLIEKRTSDKEFKTVWCIQHNQAQTKGKIKQVYDQNYWLRIIHNRNVLNKVEDGPGEKNEAEKSRVRLKGFETILI